MNPTVLNSAIDELFPDIDSSLKTKISQDVSGHMIEFLKEKAYEDDPNGLKALDEASQGGSDLEGRSKMYGEQIVKKLLSLNKEDQERIGHEFDEELVNVVNKVYKAYV